MDDPGLEQRALRLLARGEARAVVPPDVELAPLLAQDGVQALLIPEHDVRSLLAEKVGCPFADLVVPPALEVDQHHPGVEVLCPLREAELSPVPDPVTGRDERNARILNGEEVTACQLRRPEALEVSRDEHVAVQPDTLLRVRP